MKRGFTIIELLLVIAILGILLGLSVTAITGAVKKARDQQAEACVALVNQGASVYYTLEGEWPGTFQKDEDSNVDYHALKTTEVKSAILALVEKAREGNPPMDISGLYVSDKNPDTYKKVSGMDFISAIRGTERHPTKMSTGSMHFGYPESEHGYFRRFAAKYYPKTDRLVFSKQDGD